IFCGGTGLYFKAFLEGLGEAPPSDEKLRAELEVAPLADLLRELEQRDPATFAAIDKQNPRRVIRAVEVIRLTGKPFSEQRAAWSARTRPRFETGRHVAQSESGDMSPHSKSELRFVAFSRNSADLHARINARVDEMFRRGLVAETRELLTRGLERNQTALQAVSEIRERGVD
ncbi:MAG: tRNA dimethylallyltransferase, partial [Verrucomicrobia bacterium]|nr:tRNA dimethylallyltransferase [Verrucomicrobiota bacterium]